MYGGMDADPSQNMWPEFGTMQPDSMAADALAGVPAFGAAAQPGGIGSAPVAEAQSSPGIGVAPAKAVKPAKAAKASGPGNRKRVIIYGGVGVVMLALTAAMMTPAPKQPAIIPQAGMMDMPVPGANTGAVMGADGGIQQASVGPAPEAPVTIMDSSAPAAENAPQVGMMQSDPGAYAAVGEPQHPAPVVPASPVVTASAPAPVAAASVQPAPAQSNPAPAAPVAAVAALQAARPQSNPAPAAAAAPAVQPARQDAQLLARIDELEAKIARIEAAQSAAPATARPRQPARSRPVARSKPPVEEIGAEVVAASRQTAPVAFAPSPVPVRATPSDAVTVLGATTKEGSSKAILEFAGAKHTPAVGDTVPGLGRVSSITIQGGVPTVEINGITYR